MSRRKSSLLLVLALIFGVILSVSASSQTVANANQATAEVTAATPEATIVTPEATTVTPEPTTATVVATVPATVAATVSATTTDVPKPTITITLNPPVSTWAGPYRVKATVAYAWVRFDASPYAGIFTTIYPGTVVNAVAAPTGTGLIWDGIQWWGRVTIPTSGVTGFVEYTSLEQVGPVSSTTSTPIPSGTAANWSPATPVKVKLGVPFAWLRSVPSSSGSVLYQTSTSGVLSIQDKAQSDGTQWWWPVRDSVSNIAGWVEQNSLDLVTGAATATPTLVATGTVTPSAAAANWQPTNIVRVKLTVPFAWLRSVPSSFGSVLYQESTGILLNIQDKAQSDGTQWWWPVRDSVSNVVGWVEQNSLDLVTGGSTITPTATGIGPQPTATAATWNVSTKVRVKLTIPFSWMRSNANSYASVNYTAPTGSVLEVMGGPQTDTTQWWWLVKISGTDISGWVEQNSLETAP